MAARFRQRGVRVSIDSNGGSAEMGRSLDELQFLLTVEHALIVEYLSICCALGHDLRTQDGGPSTQSARDAANAANNLAAGQMLRVASLARALHRAGRFVAFGRARSISDAATGTDISLDPPSREQLEQMLDREESIAAAIDARYAQVESWLGVAGGISDELLEAVRDGTTHRRAVPILRDHLGAEPVGPLLRATRRFGATEPEQVLARISNRAYGDVVTALAAFYGDLDGASSGDFRLAALGFMDQVNDANRALVHAGLLPQFRLP
ncbi:MAG TPA: hypothetical protein VI357_05075 [Mycobacteriales bacterium]